jgi:pimeloyl-ACP methyl ester carboxylesterase
VSLPPPLSQRRGAIVLVHGAWVGEWSWLPVLPLLTASARAVHAVSLAGHGARRRELGPHLTLDDHVADVVGVIETHDLFDVTLVGHSYGGRVINLAYACVPERVARMVFLDAHAPLAADTGQTPERVAEAAANGGMLPFHGYDPDPADVGGPEGVAWFMERVVPQSFATFGSLGPPLPDSLAKTYVAATGYSPSRFTHYAEAAAANRAWDYVELPASHWLMFSHPNEVAEIILRRAPPA